LLNSAFNLLLQASSTQPEKFASGVIRFFRFNAAVYLCKQLMGKADVFLIAICCF